MSNISDTNSPTDFWYYYIGVNCIPFDSKTKVTYEPWSKWQDQPIPIELYESWKANGSFDKGIAVIAGKIWRGKHKGKYLACIDFDNEIGIKELISIFGEYDSLDKLAQDTIVEQHKDDFTRAHVYFVVEKPLTKKSGIRTKQPNSESRDIVPLIEIKSEGKHGTMIVSPSIHKNGFPYEIIGTKEPIFLNKEESKGLEDALNRIYDKYGTKTDFKDNKISISELFDENFVIYEGNNRHVNVLRICESLFSKSNRQLTFEELLARALNWNEKHCKGPLPLEEVKKLVKQAMMWISNDKENKMVSTSPPIHVGTNKTKEMEYTDRFDELSGKIPDRKFVEFIINTCKKTIKREDALVRLILYTGLSTYTKDPLNLGIIAPTSEGKTYAVSEVMKLFPKEDVWMLGNMSPKVLIRDRGILVDSDNQPIQEKIEQLNKIIRKEKEEDKKDELIEQRRALYDNSKMLIDLSNMTLIFLEPPHSETWNILKPILSHDALEIEHPYVYKADKSLEVKHVVTRGWPACIFCSAKDDSSWSMWDEIQSRFFIASPNMIKQKYFDSNTLIGQKKGLPQLVQEQIIVSKDDIKTAKKCIVLLREELLASHANNVWIPFESILSESLPAQKGSDVRITIRIFSLLDLVTKINAIARPKLVYGNETLAISLFTDLEEVLKITHNLTGIPSYKLEFFREVFVPLFSSKNSPLEKDGIIEDRIAVYTNELVDFLKQKLNKTLTTDALKKTYLTELKNNGLIDDFQSAVDKRKNGYYPIIDVSQFKTHAERDKSKYYTNGEEDDNYVQFFKLKLSNNYYNIEENWLNIEVLNLIKYGIGNTNIFKILNKDNDVMCICQFVHDYIKSGSLNRYFQTDENCIYSTKIFGNIRKIVDNQDNK